ncbi:6-phospho-beta-glucosidase, partial [Virgibacillus halodenitrificans]|nr:6-phospho-beta-glucosidase [Virgibacillus halodenitrificans]
MALKVVVIGGGSSYTPEIIEGLIKRHSSFPVTEIVLVDIEAGKEKLQIIGELSKRMIEKSGKSINLSWTLDRRKALQGADFVSTQIRVGGLEARAKDERIPLSHGFIGQETNGAGGIFKAFRTIPVLMELAADIHHICPDAWMINFTNPAGIITEALLKHSQHDKVIGVCNIPYNMRHSTAEILHVAPEEVDIQFVGMNHFVFGRRVFVSG